MTKIRFYIIEADERGERLYLKRYSAADGIQGSNLPESGATFTRELNGYHRANVFHAIMSHILAPVPVFVEITDED